MAGTTYSNLTTDIRNYTEVDADVLTTAVINSMVIANVHTADVTVDVEVQSDTSGAGRTASNGNVTLLNAVTIPVNTSLEVLHKLVLEATDVLLVDCSTTNGAAVTLSYLEIT